MHVRLPTELQIPLAEQAEYIPRFRIPRQVQSLDGTETSLCRVVRMQVQQRCLPLLSQQQHRLVRQSGRKIRHRFERATSCSQKNNQITGDSMKTQCFTSVYRLFRVSRQASICPILCQRIVENRSFRGKLPNSSTKRTWPILPFAVHPLVTGGRSDGLS